MNQPTETKAAPPNKFVLVTLAVFFGGAGLLALDSCRSNAAYETEQARAQPEAQPVKQPLSAVARDPDARFLLAADQNWKESAEDIRVLVGVAVKDLHEKKLDDTAREILKASLLVDGKGQKEFKAWCVFYMTMRGTERLSKKDTSLNLRALYISAGK